MMEIVVSDNERIRIDKYLINNTDMSRNKIQKLINDGKIRVNGGLVKASYLVNINDKIEITHCLLTIERKTHFGVFTNWNVIQH